MQKPDPNQVNAVVNLYPWCDHLMAETLLMMSAQGKLDSFLKDVPVDPPPPTSKTIVGAITVEEFSPTIENTEDGAR
jgi:hypothetical protein